MRVCLRVRLGFEVTVKVGFKFMLGCVHVCVGAPAEEHIHLSWLTFQFIDQATHTRAHGHKLLHKVHIDCPLHCDANTKILTGRVSGPDRSTLNRLLMFV